MIRCGRIRTGPDGNSVCEEGSVALPHESAGWFRHEEGKLEFGAELASAADESLAALLGASPGASVAAYIALQILQRCFAIPPTTST